jgi:flavin reductase (DIM6/NTAB) family NADH-FMN oxidoreductase RutF
MLPAAPISEVRRAARMTDPNNIAAEMRTALRRLAKAVVVITAQHNGQRFAMSATAVNEVAVEPASMLVCVNRSASIYPPLQAGASFGINILNRSQELISRTCSGTAKGEARFAIGSWLQSSHSVPYLSDAQATLICTNETNLLYGSHCIFIGRVVEVFCHPDVDPLIYANGEYRCMAPL